MSEQADNPQESDAASDIVNDDVENDAVETPSPPTPRRLFGILAVPPLPAKLRALNKRTRIIISAAAVGLLGVVISAPLLLAGGGGPKEVVVSLGGPLVQHEFPLFLADLKPGRRRSSHVKLKMVIEIDAEDMPHLVDRENAIMAGVTAHLRDQTREDLYGKDGTYRLRGELLDVVNRQIAPARAASILFTEFLVD